MDDFMNELVEQIMDSVSSMDITNMKLPNPGLITYYRNMANRTIWLDASVDVGWLEYSRMIIQWNKEDEGKAIEERVPIKLFFFSPGGDLDVNNSFIDLLRLSKTPTVGINIGSCCSAAAFCFLSCQKRYMLKRSYFLLHTGSAGGIAGTAEQVQSFTEHYNKQVQGLKDYLIEDIGIDKKIVTKGMKGEWFIDANEALKLNLVDAIVDDIELLM